MFDLYGRSDQMLYGGLVTIQLCLTVLPFMIVIGLLGASAKLSRYKALRVIGESYTVIIRGIPELLVILLIYFGGTIAVQKIAEMISGEAARVDIPAFWSGVAALALVQGAFASEVFRAAMLAIPKGQIEAAVATGMTPVQIFYRIKLPQLWRFALPGLNNLFQVLIKDTALISVVGVEEILRKAAVGAGTEKAPFTFYLVAMLMFLAFTTVSLFAFNRLEKRANRGIARA
ncbi:ABC transporter permease [Thalassospira marina]|uniref:ABC transporter permease n=1 Tax=Thalassospira marina TaxID=2048283 RepID=A0A2N3KUU5_9PROT|nr:ABC transporter permease [Thalassospira marina]AUG52908.1 ABC transporter permease [Thalassospira marina]PKR54266.1 ABC transporter permease [Thalassospira marina]